MNPRAALFRFLGRLLFYAGGPAGRAQDGGYRPHGFGPPIQTGSFLAVTAYSAPLFMRLRFEE